MNEKFQELLDSIAAALIHIRRESRMTQRQAAAKANSTQARISDLENGKADVFVSTLQRWAAVYGYDVEIHFVPVEEEEGSDDDG